MIRLLFSLLVLLALSVGPGFAREDQLLTQTELLALYGDSSDEISEDQANELLRELCNDARREAGLQELGQLDLAAYMARRHAREMVRLRYSSHYDTDGLNPVERYNRLGGTDYVQENLILLEINRPLLLTERLVRTFHREYMDSPQHLRTMLSPQATHMGSAFELAHEGEIYTMAAVSEFICERGDYSRLPQQLQVGDSLLLSGQFAHGVEAGYIGIGLHDQPQPLDPAQLNALPPFYTLPQESFQIPLHEDVFDGQARQPDGVVASRGPGQGRFRIELEVPAQWAGQTVFFYVFAYPPGDVEMRCVSCQTLIVNG